MLIYILESYLCKTSNIEILVVSLRHENTGLVSSGVSFTSWGEGVSLALFGHPSSDGITKKHLMG